MKLVRVFLSSSSSAPSPSVEPFSWVAEVCDGDCMGLEKVCGLGGDGLLG